MPLNPKHSHGAEKLIKIRHRSLRRDRFMARESWAIQGGSPEPHGVKEHFASGSFEWNGNELYVQSAPWI